MYKMGKRLGLIALVGAVALVGGYSLVPTTVISSASAAMKPVNSPELEKLVYFTTVRRGSTREYMLTTQSALDAIQAGEPVPTGTHVVLVDFQSDELARYLVSENKDRPRDWSYTFMMDDESPT